MLGVLPGNANASPSRGFGGMNLPIGDFPSLSYLGREKLIVVDSNCRRSLSKDIQSL